MNNAINLLPCPMCGCNSITIKNEQPTDSSGGYFIECPDCGTSTSLRYACGDDPIPLLAEQWNRRTSSQHLHQIAAPAQDARTAFEAISRFMKCEWNLDWDPAGFYDDAKTDTAFTWFEQGYMRAQQASAPQATPFMWAIQEPGGGAYMDDGCVSSVREDVQAEVDGLNSGLDADDDPYQVVAVYLAAAPLAAVHPDDAAVDALAALMKAKLAEKRAKGYGGWNDKTQCPQQRLSDMLRSHVDKGDPVDVANFCAMLSARGEGIGAAPDVRETALAHLDGLLDDAAAHIYPSDLRKCQTSECTVTVASVRMGNREERSIPLFSREQVVEAFDAALAVQAKQGGA